MALSAIVALVVLLILILGMSALALGTLRSGTNSARVRSLRNTAESGIQYGYWQYAYNGAMLPYNKTRNFGPGKFSVTVVDNSANIIKTIKVTSTSTQQWDSLTTTRVFPNPASITGLFNTGTDSSGNIQAGGTQDTHYTYVASPVSNAPYIFDTNSGYPGGAWTGNGTKSRWICPAANTNGVNAYYQYRTTFTVNGPPQGVTITLTYAADDVLKDLQLNGVSVVQNTGGYNFWTTRTISSGFVSGTNTLDFIVHNSGGGPTGLMAQMTTTP